MGGGPRGEQPLVCGICHQLPKVVMESQCCFTIFCKNCVLSLNFTDGDCPNCGKSGRGFQLNVPLQRIVDQQETKCRFHALGCNKSLEFKDKEEHETNCPFALIQCPFECGSSVLSKELEHHKEAKCLMREVQCSNSGCEEILPLAFLNLHHKNECKYTRIQCTQCFKELAKKGLQEHINNTCPETLVSCPYHECGCCDQIPRRLLLSHLDKNTKLHLQLVLKVVGKQQQEISSLKKELQEVKNKKVSLIDSLQIHADNTVESAIQWLSEPKQPSWLPNIKFNLMYLSIFQLMVLMLIVYNSQMFGFHYYLAITSYCIFMTYLYIVQQMDNVSWYLKLGACIYFNAAWVILIYVCI